jgi:hypothetical protein
MLRERVFLLFYFLFSKVQGPIDFHLKVKINVRTVHTDKSCNEVVSMPTSEFQISASRLTMLTVNSQYSSGPSYIETEPYNRSQPYPKPSKFITENHNSI